MVKVNVRGKEIEISKKLIVERGPPRDEYCPPPEEWSTEGYERALTKVQRALETLDDLKNSYHAKELSPEQLAAELGPFRNFYATYTCSISARGRGNDPTDDWFDNITRIYDLGGIVCKTSQEMADLAEKDG